MFNLSLTKKQIEREVWNKGFEEMRKERKEVKDYNEVLGNLVEGIFKNTKNYNAEVKATRADERLSEVGKQEALSDLYKSRSKKHKELKAALEQKRGEFQKELSQAAYAPSQKDLPNFNSAMDRLDAVKHEDELIKRINRAERINDKITILAGGLSATEKGHWNALNRVKEILPDVGESLDRLADFQRKWGNARDKGTVFQERIYTSAPQKPAEVPNSVTVKI